MNGNIFTAAQLGIIVAVISIISDIISLKAAVLTFEEEQQAKKDAQREIENEISRLQEKLRYYKK